MALELLTLFLAGVFLANGVPHFVKGVTGQHQMTPFARQSSALVNMLWGAANFVAGEHPPVGRTPTGGRR